jgi:hypothetical protein
MAVGIVDCQMSNEFTFFDSSNGLGRKPIPRDSVLRQNRASLHRVNGGKAGMGFTSVDELYTTQFFALQHCALAVSLLLRFMAREHEWKVQNNPQPQLGDFRAGHVIGPGPLLLLLIRG